MQSHKEDFSCALNLKHYFNCSSLCYERTCLAVEQGWFSTVGTETLCVRRVYRCEGPQSTPMAVFPVFFFQRNRKKADFADFSGPFTSLDGYFFNNNLQCDKENAGNVKSRCQSGGLEPGGPGAVVYTLFPASLGTHFNPGVNLPLFLSFLWWL